MKLRIKGNTIRFRLTQTEIDSIRNGSVEDKTDFPGGSSLIYKIQKGSSFDCEFRNGEVIISVTSNVIEDWTNSSQVSIDNSITLNDGSQLEISLEKDFKCLTVRPKEDETDMYPNPLEKHSKC